MSYLDLALLTAFDLVLIVIFTVGIYFRRHRRKDLVLVFAFFNICLFIVVRVIQMTEVAAALGFAILSVIRLRSEPFNNREIGYFFGALVLGLVNGIGTPHLGLTVATNLLVLAAVFVLDHPRVLQGGAHQHIVLDIGHTDPVLLRSVLEQRLGPRWTILSCIRSTSCATRWTSKSATGTAWTARLLRCCPPLRRGCGRDGRSDRPG